MGMCSRKRVKLTVHSGSMFDGKYLNNRDKTEMAIAIGLKFFLPNLCILQDVTVINIQKRKISLLNKFGEILC